MRNLMLGLSAAVAGLGAVMVVACSGGAPKPESVQGSTSAPATATASKPYLQWPVLPGNEAYAAIDGKHLHEYVVQHAAISRRYRDQGHPQFWGRLVGTSGDEESLRWFEDKYKEIGLSDVRVQPIDLAPKWFPQSWEVTASGGGKTLPLGSAYPGYRSPGTPPDGLDLEVVYVGLGSEADFTGRDVRGKAVLIFDPFVGGMGPAGAAAVRAEAKGAAAVLIVITVPGNVQMQYTSRNHVPNFALGDEDGNALRELIAAAPAGRAPRVKLRLDVKEVPNLRTGVVWGTLPGATNETVYVVAHRDGWFDAGVDNGSGIAVQVGLAEYFAKIPRAQRRRTMVFLAIDGHHFPGERTKDDPTGEGGEGEGRSWIRLQGERGSPLFAKTALVINCEHSSSLQSYVNAGRMASTNTYMAQPWFAGGPTRPNLEAVAKKAFQEFGVSIYDEPTGQRPMGGELGFYYNFAPGVTTEPIGQVHYFHTDKDTPEIVPWSGLEATARSYAKIIDEVNKIDLKDLQRPIETRPDPLTPEAVGRADKQPKFDPPPTIVG